VYIGWEMGFPFLEGLINESPYVPFIDLLQTSPTLLFIIAATESAIP